MKSQFLALNSIKSTVGRIMAGTLLCGFCAVASASPPPLGVPPFEPPPAVPADQSGLTVKVELVGNIPNDTPFEDKSIIQGAYNMGSPVIQAWRMIGIDENGALYRYSFLLKKAIRIFHRGDAEDMGIYLTEPDDDQELDTGPFKPILNVLGGKRLNELYVVFQIVPDELNPDRPKGVSASTPVHNLPVQLENIFYISFVDGGFWDLPATIIENKPIYDLDRRVDFVPFPGFSDYAENARFYTVVYKFKFNGWRLSHPRAIVAFQSQKSTRHDGGGMVLAPDGRIILATGDWLPAGAGGRSSPQRDSVHAGKILLIDPDDGSIEVAAKGNRNIQRIQATGHRHNKRLVWSNIGGSTAEEINTLSMADLLDTSTVENFGWGCTAGNEGYLADGNCNLAPTNVDIRTREGTFFVEQGILVAGFGPFPLGSVANDPGFIQPLAQYGRGADPLNSVAVTGPAISKRSFDEIKVLFSDLNRGTVFAVTDSLDTVAATVKTVNLVDKDNNPIVGNTLNGVRFSEGDCPTLPVELCRSDPRFFIFPGGKAGVLIEATGNFYKLTEVSQ